MNANRNANLECFGISAFHSRALASIRGLPKQLPEIFAKAQLSSVPRSRGSSSGAAWFKPGSRRTSNTYEHPSHNEWYLDLNDGLLAGIHPQPDGSAHEGMYGHVVPLGDGRIQI